jgi:hypothetical protein
MQNVFFTGLKIVTWFSNPLVIGCKGGITSAYYQHFSLRRDKTSRVDSFALLPQNHGSDINGKTIR